MVYKFYKKHYIISWTKSLNIVVYYCRELLFTLDNMALCVCDVTVFQLN